MIFGLYYVFGLYYIGRHHNELFKDIDDPFVSFVGALIVGFIWPVIMGKAHANPVKPLSDKKD